MQASKSVYLEGRREDRAEAIRTGMVAVRVVPLARQAARKAFVIWAGMVRERNCEVDGVEILLPDQRPGRGEAGVEVGMEPGCMSSRLGRSGEFGDSMVVVVSDLGLESRAARKSF